MPRRETSRKIDQDAAIWVAKVDGGALSATEQAALDAWLGEDVRRVGAYARMSAVLARTDPACALGGGFDPARLARSRAPRLDATRRHMLWAGGAAASMAVMGVVGARVLGRTISTARGQILRVPLPDGSTVTLNTASRLLAAYDDRERRVRLRSGEALFEVAKDAARPFIVEAGALRVQVVGTAFSVRRREGGGAQVVVREGVVDVRTSGADKAQRLAANAILTIARGGAPPTRLAIGEDETTRRLAWREGMLSFEGEPLGEAAAEFERYSGSRILIDDPRLAREPVSGLFSVSDPQGFARTAALSFDARVSVSGDTIHVLR